MRWHRKIWVAATVTVLLGYAAWGQFSVLLGYEVEGDFFVTSDGVPLHYTDTGETEAEAVVLVHGFAMNIDLSWRKPGVIHSLAERYRVIAYDARGHGLSGKPIGEEHYGTRMVDDIAELMSRLGIQRAHLVGQSMGGLTILKFVAKYPERLLSAAPNAIGWSRPTEENLDTIARLADSLDMSHGIAPLLHRLEPTDGSMGQFTKATLNRMVRYLNDERALTSVARGLPALCVDAEALRRNTVPVLTLIGSLDPLLPDAYELHEVMAGHTLVEVAEADHFYITDTPEYHATLMAFLARHGANRVDAEQGLGS